MTTASRRTRRVAAFVARTGLLGSALMVVLTGLAVLSSAAPDGGDARIHSAPTSTGGGEPIDSGGSATAFTIALPTGAACSGDSANGGYRIQSYMVASSIDPATLRFGANGPTPAGFGSTFRQPLYTTDGNGYVNAQTANADPAPGPGPIVNIPNFDFAVWGPGDVPAGTYNVGIACTLGPATSADQLDRFWNVAMTFTTDESDSPAQVTWTVEPSATTTTTSSTSTTTSTTLPPASTTSSTTSSTSTTSTTTSTTLPPATTTSSTTSSTTSTTLPPASTTSSTTTSTTSTSTSTTIAPTSTTVAAGPAQLTVGESSGAPGTVTSVEGHGFAPGSQALVMLFSDPVILGTTTADTTGAVRTSVTIPAVTAGAHRIEVQGVGSDGRSRTVSAPFTVTAPAAAAPAGSGATLPRTGRAVVPLVVSAGLLLLFGRVVVLLGRETAVVARR